MLHTERTSPYYDDRIDLVADDVEAAKEAIRARDLEALADVAVTSAMRMHASAMAANPPVLYWNGTTVDLIQRLERARREGAELFFSIDAGPHVKIFCGSDAVADVRSLIGEVGGVQGVHEAGPGAGVRLVEE